MALRGHQLRITMDPRRFKVLWQSLGGGPPERRGEEEARSRFVPRWRRLGESLLRAGLVVWRMQDARETIQ